MSSTDDILNDLDKYSKMWDDAQKNGLFKQEEKPVNDDEESLGGSFFGMNFSSDVDSVAPINEVDSKYWSQVAKLADQSNFDPLQLEDTKEIGNISNTVANAHNPVIPSTVGKDQDVNVKQNWAVGGKEYFELAEMKVKLEQLEGKLSSLFDDSEKDSKNIQSQINNIKSKIDDLSNSLSGSRFSDDG
jgi:hypothetical protein